MPLLPLLSVVVSWEDSSTCGDLITEWLGVMEDEPVTAEPFCLGGVAVPSCSELGGSFLSSELRLFTLHFCPKGGVSLCLTGCTFRSTATV